MYRLCLERRRAGYYGNKTSGSAMSGILNVFLFFSVCVCVRLHNEPDIRRSNQYQQAPVKTRPSHSSTAQFRFPVRLHHRRPCVTICPPVSRVKLLTQQIPAIAGKVWDFPWQLQLPAAYQRGEEEATASNSAWRRRCVCISPTAAPGLHLIRPSFLSCPNRQALRVMNISHAGLRQQQVSVSVPVSSQWLWSAALLHPKGVQ